MMSTSFSELEDLPPTPEPTEIRPAANCTKPIFLYDGAFDAAYTLFASSMLIAPTVKPDETPSVSVYAWTIFTFKFVFLLINLINLRMIHLYTTRKMRCFIKTEYLLIVVRFCLLVLGNYELCKKESATNLSLSFSFYLVAVYLRVRNLVIAHSYFTRDNGF